MRLGLALGLAGGVGLGAGQGLAEPQAPAAERSFSLDYRAPAECPGGLALVTAIQARTQRAALVPSDAAAVRFTAELLEDGRTRLDVDMPEGSFRRDFVAPCQDALASIAIIAAMVLETDPDERASLVEGAPGSVPREAAFPLEAPAALPAAAEPAKPAPVAAPQPMPAPRAERPARPTPQPRALVLAALAGGAVETAVAPTPPFGVLVGFEGFVDGSRGWAPGVAAGMFVTTTATQTTADGEGQFQLLAGHVKGCAWRPFVGSSFRLAPCVIVEVGSLAAAGGGTAVNVRTPSMPWLAAGASLRAQLELVRGLALEATGGLKLLARRDTFVFRPDSLVYEVPRWSLGLGLGLSLRVP